MSESGLVSAEGSSAAQVAPAVVLPHEPPPPEETEVAPEQKSLYFIGLLKWVFSFPAMLGTMLVGAVFVLGRYFKVDPDLWWHLKNGQNILATHHLPTTDSFSFTIRGQPWISMEWLADIFFAAIARVGGLQGLDALLILLGGAVMVALYGYGTLRSGNSKAGLAAAVALLVLANGSFSLRPQMLGYLFLILTLIALEQFRQGDSRWIWLLPALMLVWVNAHGSFIIGMLAIGTHWFGGLLEFRIGGVASRKWNRLQRIYLEAVFLLCLLALTITPYGTQLAVYPFHTASSLPIGIANVMEWQSMPFNIPGGKFFLVLLLGFLAVQTAFRFTWRVEELALFLFGAMMACLHVRFVLVFVPFFAPLLATVLARWVPKYERAKDQHVLNAVLMTAAVTAMIWFFPSRAEMEKTVAEHFPVRAVEYMQQHSIAGPLLNNYDFGGYLVWKDRRVFVDGRADPYERGGALADYFYIMRLKPGALTILGTYGIESCLLERDDPLATLLATQPEWQKVYSDDLSLLFVRRETIRPAGSAIGAARLEQREGM